MNSSGESKTASIAPIRYRLKGDKNVKARSDCIYFMDGWFVGWVFPTPIHRKHRIDPTGGYGR
jgi:hypothetical protein